MYSKVILVLLATAIFATAVLGAPAASIEDRDSSSGSLKIKPKDVLGDFDFHADPAKNGGKLPYLDCHAIKEEEKPETSGIYTLQTDELRRFLVFCDMKLNGSGWTVIMRRKNGSTNFNRNWIEYKNGFGDLNGNFWLGLENIHALTKATRGRFELYVGLQSHDKPFFPFKAEDVYKYAHYKTFRVGDASSNYQLTVGDYSSSSTAGDSFGVHNGREFSTPDADNDGSRTSHCAKNLKSGWWFANCRNANLNGAWSDNGAIKQGTDGIVWEGFKGESYSLKSVVMAIRRVPIEE